MPNNTSLERLAGSYHQFVTGLIPVYVFHQHKLIPLTITEYPLVLCLPFLVMTKGVGVHGLPL